MTKRNKNYPDVLSDITKDYIKTLKREITRMRTLVDQLKNKQKEILDQLYSARSQTDEYYQMTKQLKKRISELEEQDEGF
ncbi:hypothetical protein [Anaerococcus marasmi]|uniref:hypothetical protein n=1 Tax=Anaerococcus marasmi TaxID=2057797 RepID=UPI000CF90F4B|nr:hypothetical protein [Anaerococcus marasmi]